MTTTTACFEFPPSSAFKRTLNSLGFIADRRRQSLVRSRRMAAIQTTDKPGEKSHNRGVAYTPKRGARVVLHHRKHGEQP